MPLGATLFFLDSASYRTQPAVKVIGRSQVLSVESSVMIPDRFCQPLFDGLLIATIDVLGLAVNFILTDHTPVFACVD
jgi:hypothetical protein